MEGWSPRRAAPFDSVTPVVAHVLGVVVEDNHHLRWQFDVPIDSLDDASGLLGAGETADSWGLDDATTLSAEYADSVNAGDPWAVDLPQVSITFASGATLLASSGIVSE